MLIGSAATYFLTGVWDRISRERGLLSKDLHKPRETWGTKIGGLPASLIIIVTTSAASLFLPLAPYPLLTASVFFASMGLIDDAIGLRNSEKIALSGVPFLLFSSYMAPFPPFDVNPLIQLVAVTLFGIYVTNAFNTLAGFNGLEAGSSLIIYLTLSLLLIARGDLRWTILLISASVLLSFLPHNWFPARVFPGNVMTFLLGGLVSFLSAQAGLYWPLLVMTIPHGFDFLLKLMTWRRTERKVPSRVREDGTLISPPNRSLAQLLIERGVNREYDLVRAILGMEAALAALTLLIHLPS